MRNRNLLKHLGKSTLAILLSACMAAGTPGVVMAAESESMETEQTTENAEVPQSETETAAQELQTEVTEPSTEKTTEEPESAAQFEENQVGMPSTELPQTENTEQIPENTETETSESQPDLMQTEEAVVDGGVSSDGNSLQQPRSTDEENWEAINQAVTLIQKSVIEVKWEDVSTGKYIDNNKLTASVIESINIIPGVADTGVSFKVNSILPWEQLIPVTGTLDKPEGVDGKVNVSLYAYFGGQSTSMELKIIIKPISFTDPKDYKDLQDTENLKQVLENTNFDLQQEDAYTEEALWSKLIGLINSLPEAAEGGWKFTRADFEGSPEISLAHEGTLENPKGEDGEFFRCSLYIRRGKASTFVPVYGDIFATPFEKTADGKIYKQLQDAVDKINSTRFKLSQEKAGTQEQAAEELFSQVNGLKELTNAGIKLGQGNMKTTINYSAAKQGTAAYPEGIDGYLWFWVKIPKGKYESDALVSSVIKAEPYIEKVDPNDKEAVDKVKELIDNKTITLPQSTAMTKDLAVAELLARLNAINGMNETGIKLSAENIYSCPDFRLAQAGTEGNPEGIDGGCSITLSVTKGLANIKAQVSLVITADKLSGQWKRNSKGWWYEYKSGTYPKSTWALIDGKSYYFDASGYMKTGWQKLGGKWYYLKSSGEMATGWQKVNGSWYYLKDSGEMSVGWQQVGSDWYYLKSSGAMASGWQKLGGIWYYLKSGGAMATGWAKVNGKWYYLKENGAMATGWQKVGDEWYYLKSSGAMATGWQKIGNTWYYLKSSGAMAVGWAKVNGKWYYLKESGAMAVGWQRVAGEWYYLNSSGAMATGWKLLNNKWYYLKANGAMATGWITVGGKKYFLNNSGAWVK